MKTLALFSLSLAVALGMPPFAPGVAQNPVLTDEMQSPLVGDWVPVQGHVVEDPAPQVRLDMEQSTGELEIKVKPQVREEPEGEVVKKEQMFRPDVKAESEVEPEVKVESEVKEEPDAQEEFLVQMSLEAETATGQEIEERHIDMEGKYEVVGGTNMELEPLDDELSEVETSLRKDPINQPLLEEGLMRENDNTEPEVEPEDKVALEVKVEPDVKEEFLVQMSLEAEMATSREIEERHIDMEGEYEVVGGTNMELEPLDDELSEVETSVRATFQNQSPVHQHLPGEEEEEELMRENDNVLDGEPIMELEPLDDDNMELSVVEKSLRKDPVIQPLLEEKKKGEEEGLMRENYNVLDGEPIMELEPLDDDNTELSGEEQEEEAFLHQQVMPDTTIMEERPALDMMGQQMPSLEEYLPKEEAEYLMVDEPGRFVREEAHFEEMGDGAVFNGGVQVGVAPKREKKALLRKGVQNLEERRLSPNQDKQGWSHCPGVTLEGKCYQFFKGPKSAADAEFFCQEQFAGGHLASITNTHIHGELLKMMLQQSGGHTRTWIGGLRYLETGRFIWLDGSHWSYADWLTGKPIGITADSDGCVEVLAHENGKFNNSACWERQAFICSHPY